MTQDLKNKFGIKKISFFNALKHARSEVDISLPAQLVGANNLGKTSLIRSLSFLFLDDVVKRSYFDAHKWKDTIDHYFPRTNGMTPWIVYAATSKTRGEIMIAITRDDQSLVRYVIDHPYDASIFLEGKQNASGEKAFLRVRDEKQLMEYLLHDIAVDASRIEVVREPQEWRRLLCDDSTSSKRGLGILPFPAKNRDETRYYQFRDLISKMLSGKSYEMRDLKSTIVTLAGIRPSDAVLNFGSDVEVKSLLRRFLADRDQSLLAMDLKDHFSRIKETSFDLQESSQCLFLFAQDHLGAVAARLESVRLQEEQKKVDEEKRQDSIRAIDLAVTELRQQVASIDRERGGVGMLISQYTQDVAGVEELIAQLMEGRTVDELNQAISENQVRHSFIPKGDPVHVRGEIELLESQIAIAKRRIDMIESNQESFADWVIRVHGAKALATLRSALAPELMSALATDVLGDESFIASISTMDEGDDAPLGAIKAAVRPAKDEVIATVESLRGEIQFKEHRLSECSQSLKDFGRAKEIEDEIERLKSAAMTKGMLISLKSEAKLNEVASWRAKDLELEGKAALLGDEIVKKEDEKRAEQAALNTLKARKFDELRKSLIALSSALSEDKNLHFVEDDTMMHEPSYYARISGDGMEHEQFIEALSSARRRYETAYTVSFERCLEIFEKKDREFDRLFEALMPGYKPSFRMAKRNPFDLMPFSDFMMKLTPAIVDAEHYLNISETSIRQILAGQAKRANDFVKYLTDISKRVTELNSKLNTLRFSSLSEIRLDMERNKAMIDEISQMANAGSSEQQLMDAGNLINGQHVFEYFRDMIERGEAYHIEDMFTLSLFMKDQFGKQTKGTSTSDTGSNGTNLMMQVIMSALLLGKIFDESQSRDYLVPVYVDEADSLDEYNRDILVSCLTDHGFNPVLAHPGDKAFNLRTRYFVHDMFVSRNEDGAWIDLSSAEFTAKGKRHLVADVAAVVVADSGPEMF